MNSTNMDLLCQEIPQWSKWIDTKRRVFMVVKRWFNPESLEPSSFTLVDVANETDTKVLYEDMRKFIAENSLIRVPKG